jgi:hypothetical protein
MGTGKLSNRHGCRLQPTMNHHQSSGTCVTHFLALTATSCLRGATATSPKRRAITFATLDGCCALRWPPALLAAVGLTTEAAPAEAEQAFAAADTRSAPGPDSRSLTRDDAVGDRKCSTRPLIHPIRREASRAAFGRSGWSPKACGWSQQLHAFPYRRTETHAQLLAGPVRTPWGADGAGTPLTTRSVTHSRVIGIAQLQEIVHTRPTFR